MKLKSLKCIRYIQILPRYFCSSDSTIIFKFLKFKQFQKYICKKGWTPNSFQPYLKLILQVFDILMELSLSGITMLEKKALYDLITVGCSMSLKSFLHEMTWCQEKLQKNISRKKGKAKTKRGKVSKLPIFLTNNKNSISSNIK